MTESPSPAKTSKRKNRLVGIYATESNRNGGAGTKHLMEWIDDQEDPEQRWQGKHTPHLAGRVIVAFLLAAMGLCVLLWAWGFWPDHTKPDAQPSAQSNPTPSALADPQSEQEAQPRGNAVEPPPDGEPVRPIPDEPPAEDRPPFIKRDPRRDHRIPD